jgi:hypothetical protein
VFPSRCSAMPYTLHFRSCGAGNAANPLHLRRSMPGRLGREPNINALTIAISRECEELEEGYRHLGHASSSARNSTDVAKRADHTLNGVPAARPDGTWTASSAVMPKTHASPKRRRHISIDMLSQLDRFCPDISNVVPRVNNPVALSHHFTLIFLPDCLTSREDKRDG